MKLALLFCLLVCACDDQTTAIANDLEARAPDLAARPACDPVCSENQFCFQGDFNFVHDAGTNIVLGCNLLPTSCSSCDCIIAQKGFDPMFCFCNSDGHQLVVDCALL